MNFHLQIAKARKRAHLTQRQLADLFDLCPQSISNYETGRHAPYGPIRERLQAWIDQVTYAHFHKQARVRVCDRIGELTQP